jgi:formate-nitrite transporter family protein
VAVAPSPGEIYERAAQEGERRLGASWLEMASTGFIAGFTIVYGIVALGITHALVAAAAGDGIGKLAGALAFGLGLVFTVVGRAELFTENFLDPIAATLERRPGSSWARLVRFWGSILAFNLLGGAALTLLMTVPAVLPPGTSEALIEVAREIHARPAGSAFANAVGAGALLTLMTYLLQGADSIGSRIVIAYLVGFFLALGPFNHVVVTALHLAFGIRYGAPIAWPDAAASVGISVVGNIVGGLVFVTLTQTARARERRADG